MTATKKKGKATAAKNYPAVVRIRQNGRVVEFQFVGVGAYPYECGLSERFPRAAVYVSDETHAWLCSASPVWNERLA